MTDDNQPPLLLQYLFGETAETARQGASPRLLRWAQAFEDWLAERTRQFKPKTVRNAQLAWRRLLQESQQMPWMLTEEDIQAHAAWMETQGYARNTIVREVGSIGMFYDWCGEQGIDPQCGPGFNPAAKVKRPYEKVYASAQLLSREQTAALLGITAQDDSALGKRDHAFILARLRLGVPLKVLLQLQWGQIKQGEPRTHPAEQPGTSPAELHGMHPAELPGMKLPGEVREAPQQVSRQETGLTGGKAGVLWEPGSETDPLPSEVLAAILDYLEASGRLEVMQDEDYIFAPLAQASTAGEKDKAEDWAADRCLSANNILGYLKLYGRLVGIPEDKLNLQTLRHTAIRQHLDQGASTAEMKSFTQSRGLTKILHARLKKLPPQPEDDDWVPVEAQAPNRSVIPFKPGEGITHGFYAQFMPEEEMQAILAEEMRGIEREMAGLEELLERLTAWQDSTLSLKEEMGTLDALTKNAERLSQLRAAAEGLAEGEELSPWVEEILGMIEQVGLRKGEAGWGEKARAEALADEPQDTARKQQVASVRCMLRRAHRLALETQELAEFLRLVEIYGRGCMRLLRMLKSGESVRERAERRVREAMRVASREVLQERREKIDAGK